MHPEFQILIIFLSTTKKKSTQKETMSFITTERTEDGKNRSGSVYKQEGTQYNESNSVLKLLKKKTLYK